MYLVVGGSGFLGGYIIKNILEFREEQVISTYNNNKSDSTPSRVRELNLTLGDKDNINEFAKQITAICKKNSLKVIYLASYHHPDKVTENPELAYRINIECLKKILDTLTPFIDKFYYSSSDVVYGEGDENTRFSESNSPNPVNLYGEHKLQAEKLVVKHGYNIVRFPFLIGPSLLQYKKHFYDCIMADLAQGKEVEMFEDSYRSALDFDSSAKLLLELMDKNEGNSVVNIAGDEILSKYQIALEAADKHKLDFNLVKPIKFKEKNKIFKAKRAQSVLLDNSLLKKILDISEVRLQI